jgi:hypothetical protein
MRWAKSKILTLAMDLDGLCLMGITLFHIYYACPFGKKKNMSYICLCPMGFNLLKIHLCPGLPGFTYDFFGSYPTHKVLLKVNTRSTLVFTNVGHF